MAAFDRYPVRLRPVILQKMWGGTALRERLGKPDEGGRAGESWEASARAGLESTVLDGPAAGWTLDRYLAAMGDDFYGGPAPADGFPLLVKFIGPSDWLSVQVHPGDGAAGPGEAGKSEAWLVLDAPPGGRLVYGVNCGRETFETALREGGLRRCLRWLPVKAGDVVNIPAGTAHALGPGMLVYEIQQSSDTTYRAYDWDRADARTGRPRALHLRQALEAIDWAAGFAGKPGLLLREPGGSRTIYICNRRFTLERVDAAGRFTDRGPDGFSVWTVIGGGGRVIGDAGRDFAVRTGDSFLLPACALGLRFEGEAALIKGHAVEPAMTRRWLLQRGVREKDLAEIDWR